MSGKSKHTRGSEKGKFCATPGTPCECESSNDYIKNCKPSWADWTFPRQVRKKTGTITFQKKFEAHHVLCVSPVSKQIAEKKDIGNVIRETRWCINEKVNMLAMPLWGHTVMYYCIYGGKEPPPFENIPQHDWDHNTEFGYTYEVEEELFNMACLIKAAEHDISGDDIKATLDDMSKDFKKRLSVRGKRQKGTDRCWKDGESMERWFEPFSMASTPNVSDKTYPLTKFDDEASNEIEKIVEALLAE